MRQSEELHIAQPGPESPVPSRTALLSNKFPLKLLLAGSVLTVLLFLAQTVVSFLSSRHIHEAIPVYTAMARFHGELLMLNGQLVDSAHLYTRTGDQAAVRRYEETSTLWSQLLARAGDLNLSRDERARLLRLEGIRRRLAAIEREAMTDRSSGRTTGVLRLAAADFLSWKDQFRSQSAALDHAIAERSFRALAPVRANSLLASSVSAIVVPVLGVSWFFILRHLRQWRHAVAGSVDEMERMQHRLRIERDFQVTVLDSLMEGIVVFDPEGRTTLLNRATEELLSPSEGRDVPVDQWAPVHGLMLPGGQPLPPEEFPAVRALRGESLENCELVCAGPDGAQRRAVLANARPILTSAGERLGAVLTLHDVTEKKRAEESLKRQFLKIAALHEIDRAITGTLDLNRVLSVVADQVVSHLNADATQILLLEKESGSLVRAAGRGFRTEAFTRCPVPVDRGYAARVIREGAVCGINDLTEESGSAFLRRQEARAEEFVTCYGAPLMARGIVLGILEIFFRRRFSPDQEWLDFCQTLATQAAIAIDDATLFQSLQRSNEQLQLAYDRTLEGWVRALDLRDKETEGHTHRVTEKTVELARAMGLPEAELVHIRRGALLHDVGKLGIPDAILLKPGKLTDEEWAVMKLHPVYAYEWLSSIEFLQPALAIPYLHHERWDGTGYPHGLKGEEIPLAASIFAVVDVWDALRSDRPYRPGWSEEKVRAYLRENAGTHFNPEVVEAFLRILTA